ncbi:MAG: ATP synthase F1 subunit gamma [Bacteroidota bacterium]|nr:ATP synthase F1 subunit gamma [Candidatus Kapabacteria bacterium]MCS7302571.1 ATP synthase F1 subunit gamma [Candidatus Kapabacteria bacterium]MCX7936743.1 ATP synthase F1 subunit gamma [Chlorobiota bacterium]MDW8074213.1 ATP synthase F1 subunit gamma [Bacteroidota bacterium]MDW8271311.1 ATP synthase F1 subunit gamma [Bacteroidota bacterium]
MATLRDIRRRIVAVRNTAQITSAMRMVAAAKLRKAQNAIIAARPYAAKVGEILQSLAQAERYSFVHPFFEEREDVRNVLLIVVASDRGLCGSFNTNVFKAAQYYIERKLPEEFPKAKVHIIAVGKRAVQYFQRRREHIVCALPDVFHRLEFKTVLQIAPYVGDGFINGEYDRVFVLYNEFRSILRQEVRRKQILPIETPSQRQREIGDYIYEPSRAEILEALLPQYINLQIWSALLESHAAEHAARMVAMDNATTNARDLIAALQLEYNKARQAAITKEMLEIVGGAEALRAQG